MISLEICDVLEEDICEGCTTGKSWGREMAASSHVLIIYRMVFCNDEFIITQINQPDRFKKQWTKHILLE